MEDKIKWFGRYLGCEVLVTSKINIVGQHNIFYPNDDLTLNSEIMGEIDYCGVGIFKLILKEPKDISDDDLNELNKEWIDRGNLFRYRKSAFARKNPDILEILDYQEIDFLRSKGYAIGIPKEYYINEKKLRDE